MADRKPFEPLPNISQKAKNIVSNALASANHVDAPTKTVPGQSKSAASWAGPTPKRETSQIEQNDSSFGIEPYLAVGEGIIGAITAGNQIGGLADTQQQQNMIDSMYGIGRTEFNSFDQLQNEWNRLDNLQPNLNWEDIRGGSFNERLGTTISSTLGNTIAGAKINPYLGAAMGAGTLAWNLGNWVAGDRAATNTQKALNLSASIGENVATKNLAARGESLADYNSRNAVSHVAAKGGKITTLKEFSDGITKRAKANDTTRAAGIVREYCKGGVRIRIKR